MKCYNDECINGGAEALKTEDCFAYCSRECKAKVVMPTYDPKTPPKTVKEMQWQLMRMKEKYAIKTIKNDAEGVDKKPNDTTNDNGQ
jgi:hypothetical protein